MPIINPVSLFKANPESFDLFLRALSALHSTGVIEMLRERGQVRGTSENSPNYLAAQSARASWSMGYNRALDDLIYFKDLFLTEDNHTTPPPLDFGSLDRAVASGDLTEEERDAIRTNQPIPQLIRQPIPDTVVISRDDPAAGRGTVK